MDKSDLRSLTKFIPALSWGELCEWTAEPVTEEDIASAQAPTVEYWDVVHRFADAVLALADQAEEKGRCEDSEEEPSFEECAIRSLASIIKSEEDCPGVLLGYLKNGTVLRLLKRLDAMSK